MPYDFITVGGATEDITFYTGEGVLINNKKDLTRQKLLAFEYGAKIKIDRSFSGFGGGAANAAVSFSRLGFKTACLAAVGRDIRGAEIIKNLQKQKVDISLTQKTAKAETGFSLLLVGPGNEHVVFSNRAANDELRITNHGLRKMRETKWLYLASLSGDWPAILKNIFKVKGPKITWNPGHRQIVAGLNAIGRHLPNLAVLNVNKDEAIELVMSDVAYKSRPKNFFNGIKNLLAALKKRGPRIVLITSGKDGADAYDGNKFYHQGVVRKKERADTTGVGDAFGSSFAAGLELLGGDIKKALYLGALNTASVISQPGAQNGLLKKKDIVCEFQ